MSVPLLVHVGSEVLRCGGRPLGHESDSAGRLLAGTSKAIGRRLRAAASALGAAPEFTPK